MPLVPGDLQVTDITNISRIDADGTAVRLKNIQFIVRKRTIDAIEVPLAEFTADRVRQLVAARAAEIVAILEMS